MVDWKALTSELATLHGGMSKAAALLEVPYQNFQRLCQGRIKEPKFEMGLRILAGLGMVNVDEKVLTLKGESGTILPTQPEASHEEPSEGPEN